MIGGETSADMAELQNSDGNYEGPQVRLRKSHGGCRECKTRKVKVRDLNRSMACALIELVFPVR